MSGNQDLMRYDLLAQEALRGVVRRALEVALKKGLPGDHHFYISFITVMPGVILSEKLMKQYPEEMTIVLQHQFNNLKVAEDHFSVDLSFNGISERLIVPYAAIKGFFDPSVQFGLQFEVKKPEGAAEAAKPQTGKSESAKSETAKPESGKDEVPAEGAVISLDAFRKK